MKTGPRTSQAIAGGLAVLTIVLPAPGLSATELTAEALAGTWCLLSLRVDGISHRKSENWRFEIDGALIIDDPGDVPPRFEGTYDVVGNRIETSLALTLEVSTFTEHRMIARSRNGLASFRRGECQSIVDRGYGPQR